jgi:hypothetical protein
MRRMPVFFPYIVAISPSPTLNMHDQNGTWGHAPIYIQPRAWPLSSICTCRINTCGWLITLDISLKGFKYGFELLQMKVMPIEQVG